MDGCTELRDIHGIRSSDGYAVRSKGGGERICLRRRDDALHCLYRNERSTADAGDDNGSSRKLEIPRLHGCRITCVRSRCSPLQRRRGKDPQDRRKDGRSVRRSVGDGDLLGGGSTEPCGLCSRDADYGKPMGLACC